jgi:glycosyltransferase involved in cell wall biosynthesis
MKVFWLANYPLNDLLPELKVLSLKSSHSVSWVANLSKSIASYPTVELHIITSSAHIPYSQTIIKHNITFHVIKYTIPFIGSGFPSFFPYDSITWYKGFIKEALIILNKYDIDIVHAHGIEKGYSLLALKYKLKSITSIQGSFLAINKISPSLKGITQIPIEKYCLKNNTNFGCRTSWDKSLVLSMNNKSKVYYMPEMVNNAFFSKKWSPDNANTIVFVGSIIQRKGIGVLIEAIKYVRNDIENIKVLLLGGYRKNYFKKLQKKIAALDLTDNFSFSGTKTSNEIADILEKASLFVLPSLIENSPNSLAEAMAIGMPCIASDAGGIPSMLENNVNGLLFQSGNAKELSQKIVYLLSNRNFCKELANNARKTAYNRNFEGNVVEQTISVYKSIINAT